MKLFLFVAFSVFMFFLGAYYHKKGSIYGVRDVLRQNYRVPVNYVLGQMSRPPRLTIDVKHKHYQKLAFNREVALARGGLLPDARDEVPALLRYDERIVKARLRLKGDLPDHWRDENKWSFRIRIRSDDTLFGMKQFSIQHPRTRGFLTQWFLHRLVSDQGLIGVRYDFVNVTVNGRDLGLYAVEEHFEKRLIENNRHREGPLFRAGTWFYWYHNPGLASAVYGTAIDAYQTKQLAANPGLAKQFRLARNLFEAFREGELQTHEVFDVEKFATYFAALDLMGSAHAGDLDNMAFYYNPVTSLIEPLAADSGLHALGKVIGADKLVGELGEAAGDWYEVLFRDPVFYKAYVRALDRMSRPEFLDKFFRKHDEEYRQKLRTLHRDFPWYSFEPDVELLRHNQKRMRQAISPVKSVQAYWRGVSPENGTLELELASIYALPVEIDGVTLTGEGGELVFEPVDETILQPNDVHKAPRYQTYRFQVPAELEGVSALPPESAWTETAVSAFELHHRVLGSGLALTGSVHPWPHRDRDFLENDFIRQPPNFESFEFLRADEDRIVIARGDFRLDRHLIVPPGYTVVGGPGTRLDLVAGAKILSYSPLELRGSPEEPFVVESSDSEGQGLTVIRAPRRSVLENVRFVNLDRPAQSGWELTGAVTFYESPVTFSRCEFSRSRSEDALNVIRSEFLIEESVFDRTAFDALDVDFGEGRIVRSSFVACGNDGIDVSGTKLELEDVLVHGAGDKAVSAGENSYMEGRRITVRDSAVAVSSKDLSRIVFETLRIEHGQPEVSSVGFAVYQKKPEFGGGHIEASGVTFTGIEVPYLIDGRSSCTLNGEVLTATHENVEEKMYGNEFGKASR